MSSRALSRLFSVPRSLLAPAAGLDISDASIKWLELTARGSGYEVASYGSLPLEKGVVENGVIENPDALADALAEVGKRLTGRRAVHAALPEEGAYVFSLRVPEGSSRAQILSMIEFELEGRVPIPPTQALYDFDFVLDRAGQATAEVAVVVFVRDMAERYADVCAHAGLDLHSLEIEARSIGRAVCGAGEDKTQLLVDFGRDRTGFAVVERGVPIFTTTVAMGGRMLTDALVKKYNYTEEQVLHFKNEQGLVPEKGVEEGTESALALASSLAEEVLQHYHFWNSRRDEHGERASPLSGVLLVGGSANLRGLPDHIASRVQAEVSVPNVWRNVCSFDEYIPPMERHASLQYGTAIGLALRSYMV